MLRIASLSEYAVAAAILMSSLPVSAASAAGSPIGVWLDEEGRGAVEITECGGTLCGKVVWVKSKSDSKGCGVKILSGGKPVGGGSWDNGWIYSPEHGRKFDLALTPLGGDRLRITGYAGVKLFSQDKTWRRAPANLPRCDSPETAAKPKAAPAPAVAATKATETKKTTEQAASETITPPVPQPAPRPPTRTAKLEPVPAPAAAVPYGAQESPAAPAAQLPNEPKPDTSSTDTAAPASPSEVEANDAKGNDATANRTPPKKGGLSFEKVLKRTADGSCKLDLPWVKIKFECERL